MVTSIVDAFKRAMSKFRKETSESKVEAVVEQPLSTEKPTSSVSPGRATLSVRIGDNDYQAGESPGRHSTEGTAQDDSLAL